MAADGSFSTKPMGFDKNEVMEYISNVRKKMNEMEAEKKENDAKTAAAVKTAEEADARVQAAVDEGEKKAKELKDKLDVATVKADRLAKQVEELKKQLEDEKKKMTDMLKTGKGVDAQAQKAYAEVLEKAEADAKDITDAAKEAAEKIVADAEARRKDADTKLASFMELLRGQLDTINTGYKAVNDSAAELLGTEIAPAAVEIPDFAAMAKPAAPAEEPAKEVKPEAKAEKKKPAAKAEDKMPAKAEEKKPEPMEASFDEAWGGSELAESILADEKKVKQEVPLVNPDSKDAFGADLFGGFGEDDNAELSGGFGTDDKKEEETIDDIAPLDNSHHAKAVPDSDFANDLLAQTLTSAHLDDTADEKTRAAIKAREEEFAVQPSNVDMDDLDLSDAPNEGLSDEDELMKALRDAEASFGSLGLSFNNGDDEEEEPASSNAGSAGGLDLGGGWADLQKELEAMESGSSAPAAAPAPQPKAEEPEAPAVDDSSIWNMGSDSSSDDDMSGDMFGGFGF